MDAILYWNKVALDAVALDHTTIAPDTQPKGEQGGPTRTARALAIVHLAMYDAFNRITPGFAPYLVGLPAPAAGASSDAAIGEAACITLIDLYPGQSKRILNEGKTFATSLTGTTKSIKDGRDFGRQVALLMLTNRKNDRSKDPELYEPSMEPGYHRPDPMHPGQGYLTPHWGQVAPFGPANLTTAVATVAPPNMTSAAYRIAFDDVKALGSLASTTRTPEQSVIGVFWGYDGAQKLGTPPRLYNQIIVEIARLKANTVQQNARLFALANMAMADAGIQCWFTKYKYEFWRPVNGIREADNGAGPTGKGDGNPATVGDAFWLPFGSPATNAVRSSSTELEPTNFTPGFPAYTSGHATFGAAAFWMVKLFYNKDAIPFGFVSDEFNGENRDIDGSVRPRIRRDFAKLSDAITENARSRVYLGVHWQFDADEGVKAGKKIAELIFADQLA